MCAKQKIASYLSWRPSVISLVIMGKDPFPSGATGIPFCKEDWDEQTKSNSSGRTVLDSLGIDLEYAEAQFNSPSLLFEALRKEGILFLNASYRFIGGRIRKRDPQHQSYLEEALNINIPILSAAQNIILCGEAYKCQCWVNSRCMMDSRYKKVIHPAARNKYRRGKEKEWHSWWDTGALAKSFNLSSVVSEVSSRWK